MRKRLVGWMALWVMVLAFWPGTAEAGDVRIWVDGAYLESDVAPYIQEGRTMVPLRVISENLGIPVTWVEERQEILLESPEQTYVFAVGRRSYRAGQESHHIDVGPELVSGRTFVPVRVIAEVFAKYVDWDDRNETVVIANTRDLLQAYDINRLQNLSFVFSSGAGAWDTTTTFYEGGFFTGVFGDTDYDTRIECHFHGKFDLVGVHQDGSYALVLEDLAIDSPTGEVVYEDFHYGTLTITYVDIPYGFEKGKDYTLYPPDHPTSLLPEDFIGWTWLRYSDMPETLGVYGLFNEAMAYGMVGGQA